MFSKGNSKPTSSATGAQSLPSSTPVASEPVKPVQPRNGAPSIISADLRIVGDLTSAGDLQIDGTVEGDIQSRTVTIGESAQVTGSIAGDTIRVCGSVNGQIKGQTVTLDKSAKVVGDIHHQSLAIEPGAFLEGHCRRLERSGATSSASSSSGLGSGASSTVQPAANAPKQYAAS